ncbi:MAG: thiamine diphosphokinase [Lachnospiraceae bacterium]|nr:thiamine diphosphokinase [Lachnospiraceae bacterium]
MEPKGDICVIISGGQYTPIIEKIKEDYVIASYVIACDKGFDYATRAGITPNLVIGDFDSCKEATRELLINIEEKKEFTIERYPSEKDDTDTMLAIKRALALGYRRICIYCGLGGRVDHLYANMQSLVYAAGQGVICSMEDEENCIYALGKGVLELPRREGWSVSLFAVTDVCRGITTKGLKYPLENGELVNSFPLGMSNEWIEEQATVELKEGIMLVMLSKKEA